MLGETNRFFGAHMFLEKLPDAVCPPADATEEALGVVWRLVPALPAKPGDFLSHAALGRPRPFTVDECSWASCSLCTTEQAAIELGKLPQFKKHKRVRLNVPARSGKSLTKRTHIHFWMYRLFDPLAHVMGE